MANLSATFKLIDEMSDKLDNIASNGQQALSNLEGAGAAADNAFGQATSGSATAAQAVDGVAMSIENYENSVETAASSTDYWTAAVGSYDKSALEAVYSTEELVEMGLKSAQVLADQEQMFELCERSAGDLNRAIEASTKIHSELSDAVSKASDVMSEISDNEKISAETKEELTKASETAAEAMRELEAAQLAAQQAMDDYDAVMTSGTEDLKELENAAERAGHAAEALAEANGKASEATDELAKASDKASEESENAGKSGIEAIEGISTALAAAGITAVVKEIAEAVYQLADAYSEAEKIIVNATGATGAALDDLGKSMLKAYAGNDDALNDAAAAVGEINTRMGLTGDILADVTGKFLDYADITNTNVVGSVQNVTKIMNKWNVEQKDMVSVMDKLAYAGQISGASVDSLSNTLIMGAASFQEMGFSLDNAISMLAQFELYGMSGTTAITAMRTAVKNFSADGLDAETALQSVINEIANMENAADATALAVETFGSRAGVDMVNAIRSGAITIDTLTGSLEAADGTLEKTAAAGESLSEKWQKASNSIGAAFTTAVEPTLSAVSSGLAGVAHGFGTFLNDHPVVTKALTALGVGLGVVVLGIAAVSVASLASIPAIAAMGAAISTAIWPITLIAIGVAAVVGAVMLLVDAFSAAEDETRDMTAVTRKQYYELQDLNAEYEEACEKYGDTSEEASRLKYQVDDLSAAFEANRQTVEEFVAEVDKLCSSVNELSQAYSDGMTEAHKSEVGTLALIQKLQDLSSQSDLTAVQQKELETVTKELSETFPELGLTVDNVTESTQDYVAAMIAACEQQAELQREQQAAETYTEALKKQAELQEEIAKAEANLNAEREARGMYWDDQMQQWTNGWYTEDSPWASWTTDLDEYNDALDNLNAANAENEAILSDIRNRWQEIADAQEEAMEEAISGAEAAAIAYEGVKLEIEKLCAAYDEAYEAAKESFEGQFGLFDEASTKSEEYLNATVQNAQKALDSQLAYWDDYAKNVEVLKNTTAADLGLVDDELGTAQEKYDALMSNIQSGTEEAAGLASSMAKAVEDGNTEAVGKLANTIAEVSAKQDAIAATTADWVTGFSSQMDEIEKKMQETVEGMNLDTEAAASATATIKSYADKIRAGKDGAVSAAQEVAKAVTAALSTTATVKVNVQSSSSVGGYATGTLDAAPGLALVGEEGPELVNFGGGEVVYTADETARILDDKNAGQQYYTDVPAGMQEDSSLIRRENLTTQEKKILLEIAGQGAIDISKGVDKETVIDILYGYLKPVLAEILKQEIYEEGELAYDY